jgi:hypothetical protein
MVRMLASSVVYGGFKPLSGQTKFVKLVFTNLNEFTVFNNPILRKEIFTAEDLKHTIM